MTASSHMAGTYAPPAVQEPSTTATCGSPAADEAVDAVAHEELAARGVPCAGLGRTAGGGAGARLAQRPHQPLHVRGVLAKVRIGWPDAALEPHAAYQKYDRRAASPRASMVAMRAFTCSTFSPMTSSSSLGLPSNSIGSPKVTRYLTGSGISPSGPRSGQAKVTGKAGMRSRRARERTLARAGACSSDPTTAIGTVGVG